MGQVYEQSIFIQNGRNSPRCRAASALLATSSPYFGNEKGDLPTLTILIDSNHGASILGQLIGRQRGFYRAAICQFKSNLVIRKIARNHRIDAGSLLHDLAAMIDLHAVDEVILSIPSAPGSLVRVAELEPGDACA